MKKISLVFCMFMSLVFGNNIYLNGNYELVGVQTDGAFFDIRGRISFGRDGYSGSVGCNSFFGSMRQSGNVVEIGSGGATRKACEPNVMKLEQTFLNLFNGRFNIVLRGGDIVLYDKRASIILRSGF